MPECADIRGSIQLARSTDWDHSLCILQHSSVCSIPSVVLCMTSNSRRVLLAAALRIPDARQLPAERPVRRPKGPEARAVAAGRRAAAAAEPPRLHECGLAAAGRVAAPHPRRVLPLQLGALLLRQRVGLPCTAPIAHKAAWYRCCIAAMKQLPCGMTSGRLSSCWCWGIRANATL